MAITKEQAGEIKEHLLNQLPNFPEEKRGQIKQRVEAMTSEEVEELVESNNLVHLGAKGDCLFCKIVEGEIDSFKIAEDENNLGILEINPLSKGHSLVVPKTHSKELSASIEEFAKAVASRINERLRPKEIKIAQKDFVGHLIIEIIPLYGDETERKPANPSELKLTQEEITKPKEEIKEEIQEKKEEIVKLKPRIPR